MSDFLEKYKPQTPLTSLLTVNENLPDNELSFELWKKLLGVRQLQDASFLVQGQILKLFRDKKLYKYLDYENFSQFLSSEEISFGRDRAYLCIRTYELYVEQLKFDTEELSKMGIARLMMLAPVIKDTATKEEAIAKINEMKDLRYGDFVKEVKQQLNTEGQPQVFWSNEAQKWFCNYYDDTTLITSLGNFKKDD